MWWIINEFQISYFTVLLMSFLDVFPVLHRFLFDFVFPRGWYWWRIHLGWRVWRRVEPEFKTRSSLHSKHGQCWTKHQRLPVLYHCGTNGKQTFISFPKTFRVWKVISKLPKMLSRVPENAMKFWVQKAHFIFCNNLWELLIFRKALSEFSSFFSQWITFSETFV